MAPDVAETVFAIGRSGSDGIALLGTGFSVDPTSIASAHHVTGGSDADLVLILPRTGGLVAYQDTTNTAINTLPLEIVAADPIRDLCILRISAGSSLPHFGKLGGTDDVEPGVGVVTLGFPHAPLGRFVLTLFPTTVGARILVGDSKVKNKTIVLNTQARDGQSGGPVIHPGSGKVVAVVIGSYAPGAGGTSFGGVDPATLHQTTHAVSSEYLQVML